MRYGVGVIGAGPGSASLHVPTLARVAEFSLRHVSDGGSGRARAIAESRGACYSVGIEEILAAPDVDVVVISSPPHLHARHVLAAIAAGKRAILCEKPLAVSAEQAHEVIEAARVAGVPLVVATNHFFDPAWVRAEHHLIAGEDRVRSVSIAVSLPPNGRYHDLVSERAATDASTRREPPDLNNPDLAADLVRQLILGLAVHDLPSLRDLAPRIDRLLFARPLLPIGVAFGYVAGDTLIQFAAAMQQGGADTLWRMTITTAVDVIEVEFPPPFVHAGGAVITVRDPDGRVIRYPRVEEDGYVAEWKALAAALEGSVPVEYDELLADALYAVELADAAAEFVRSGGIR